MREIIYYKGRNRNPNKLIDLKSKALSPPRAHKAGELNKISQTGGMSGNRLSRRTPTTRWTTR
jgi:hypothetical protein